MTDNDSPGYKNNGINYGIREARYKYDSKQQCLI